MRTSRNDEPFAIDPTGRDVQGDAARIRARGPATRVVLPGGVEAWAVSSPALLRRLLTDDRVSKDASLHWPPLINGEVGPGWQLFAWVAVRNMLTAYGPDHRRLRRLISSAFTVHRTVGASAQRTWDVLTDWPRHTGTVPFTHVRRAPAPDGRDVGEGSGLVARTGLGPVAYEDRMTVTWWHPPTSGAAGRCRLRKEGGLVTGDVELTVVPVAPRRCRVRWTERVDVAGVHALPGGGAAEAVVGHLVFRRALRILAREAEAA